MEADDRLPAARAAPRSFGEKHQIEASWAAIRAQKARPLSYPKGIMSEIPVGKVKRTPIYPHSEREKTHFPPEIQGTRRSQAGFQLAIENLK